MKPIFLLFAIAKEIMETRFELFHLEKQLRTNKNIIVEGIKNER
ncbi:unnamed protein product [Moritella viscosa]|nr:unnamed protein product [Moritella viscosa]